jgi:hypothetical protein
MKRDSQWYENQRLSRVDTRHRLEAAFLKKSEQIERSGEISFRLKLTNGSLIRALRN